MTAPALRRLSITGLLLCAMTSRCNLRPLVVANPSFSILTLTVTGTPASGPASSPRMIAASMAAASASTSAGRCSTTALIAGLTASSRASAAEAASFAETFFDLIIAAISAADRRQRSSIANSVWIARLVAPPTAERHRETAAFGYETSAQPGEKISEIGDLIRRHRLQRFRHGGVIAVAAVVLVFPHGLGEIILALVGDTRDIFFAGEIGVVAGIAMILLRQRLAPLHPCRVAGIGRRRRLRQFSDEVGKGAK